MKELKEPKFWVAHNGSDIVHFGTRILKDGLVVTTGQPFLESFDNEKDLESRVDELTYVGHYEETRANAEDDQGEDEP